MKLVNGSIFPFSAERRPEPIDSTMIAHRCFAICALIVKLLTNLSEGVWAYLLYKIIDICANLASSSSGPLDLKNLFFELFAPKYLWGIYWVSLYETHKKYSIRKNFTIAHNFPEDKISVA
ncbi:hypothetical protein ASF04_26385 [Duganella sp. Leaf61]|nr:hypothetical protein ASF04_26385 [Duganella sp. Leaf61]